MTKEVNENLEKGTVEKKSFGSKVLGWIINIVIVGALVYWIVGMKAKQKKKFYQEVANTAKIECQGNQACLDNLKKHYKDCVGDFVTKHKSGKFNTKYTLDKDGFDSCLDSYKDES